MPLSPSSTRALLAQLGHFPRRALGQNFLVDGNIVRKSLELAGVVAGDTVVEIGPGLGTLTVALLEAGAEVWAVERDPRLHHYLDEALRPRFPKTLHLTLGDAVELPLAGLTRERNQGPFKVVANLPYAISTPWMDAVLSGPLPDRLVLMLQREAAERYAANPGSKAFGAISIFLQSAFEMAPGHAVASACFHPRPEVDSFLLHLVRKPTPMVFPPRQKELIRSLFQQRRKQIGSLLRDRLPDRGATWLAVLAGHGLTPQARAEEIPVHLWQNLVQPPA
ncbi:MAG: ribosomal RNA small subunit methyltransferase A [Opitutaceae bacterium]|nr:ribosomal RNA small subunit methyltransferase A [Opitutaceae bacterium]